MLGFSPLVTTGRKPRFVKNYMTGDADIEGAIRAYVSEVKSAAYPAPEHCFADASTTPAALAGGATVALPAAGTPVSVSRKKGDT
jgi:3-methyl-2-oxobutanoate hydroxymethyltransferase